MIHKGLSEYHGPYGVSLWVLWSISDWFVRIIMHIAPAKNGIDPPLQWPKVFVRHHDQETNHTGDTWCRNKTNRQTERSKTSYLIIQIQNKKEEWYNGYVQTMVNKRVWFGPVLSMESLLQPPWCYAGERDATLIQLEYWFGYSYMVLYIFVWWRE